jgi:hypothetical protein
MNIWFQSNTGIFVLFGSEEEFCFAEQTWWWSTKCLLPHSASYGLPVHWLIFVEFCSLDYIQLKTDKLIPYLPTYLLAYLLTCLLTCLFTYLLSYLFTYLLTYLLTNLLLTYLPTYLLIYLLTYLLTHSLTPRSRGLLERLTGSQLVNKFPTFYGTRRFITAFINTHHLSLSWAKSIQYISPHPTSWRSIFIFSAHLRLDLPNGLFSLDFPT